MTAVDLADVLKGELEENQVRKDFTPSEWVAIKRAIEPQIKDEAEQRMKAGKEPSGKLPKGRSHDVVASFVGIGRRTLEKAEKVVEAAEKDPEKSGLTPAAVDAGKTSVDRAYKKVKRETERPTVAEVPPPLLRIFGLATSGKSCANRYIEFCQFSPSISFLST